MLCHIDQLHSPSKGSYHRIAEGLWLTDHSDHQTVVVGVGLVIQKPHAFFCTEALYDFFDLFQIAAFTIIGYAFDQLISH